MGIKSLNIANQVNAMKLIQTFKTSKVCCYIVIKSIVIKGCYEYKII